MDRDPANQPWLAGSVPRVLEVDVKAERAILFGVAAIVVICGAILSVKGIPVLRPLAYLQNTILYISVFVILYGCELVWRLLRARPESPVRFVRDDIISAAFRRKLRRAFPMLASLVVFMPMFGNMKSAIPLFHVFDWDASFIAIDRAIHGTDPWRLLQPVLGHPIVSSGLSLIYHLWILLIYAGSIYFGFYEPSERLRLRYFFSFFAIWSVIGIGMATGFASVGPCFVEPILGNPYFREQMTYLHLANESYPVLVLDVQDQLLAWYRSGDYGLGRGITAMPSMHVALVTLYFLAFRKRSALTGWIVGCFALAILVGSVHLGYHYAIDGYVSIVVTFLLWRISGKLFPEKKSLEPDRHPA